MTDDKVVPFNPLDKRHLGESVGQALFKRPAMPLGTVTAFRGAGVYAIYYSGNFPAYKVLSACNANNNFTVPIYVGKAIPKGGRKGGTFTAATGNALFKRLVEHGESISAATNLRLDDFFCRYLVVDDIWIPLGESLLIARFTPVWNTLIDGFGNHDPGKGRYLGLRPRWDVLHPGRAWSEKCSPRLETAEEIALEIREFFRNNPPQTDTAIVTP